MLFKCENCTYTTKRVCDLLRHEQRKKPCYKKRQALVVVPIQAETAVAPQNHVMEQEVVSVEPVVLKPNVDEENENFCFKCKKSFYDKYKLRDHSKKCDGLDSKQCKTCLRLFTSRQSKWNHMHKIKCTPPSPPEQPPPEQPPTSPPNQTPPHIQTQTITNIVGCIDNSVNKTVNHITNNTNTMNNTINLNFRGNFDKITKQDIQQMIDQLERSEYIQMIQDNIKSGKYAVPRTIEHIYFNDKFPSMQTVKKDRKNDRMVEVHLNGRWEKRMVEDILKEMMEKVEAYHSEYCRYVGEKYKNVPIGSTKWNQLMRPIKSFGHMMLWYNGFTGQDIEKIGIELNFPDDEKEKRAKNKEMANIIKEHVYDKTKQLRYVNGRKILMLH